MPRIHHLQVSPIYRLGIHRIGEMYPYPYPQYVLALSGIPARGNVPPMAAPMPIPALEPYPAQVAEEPATTMIATALQDSPPAPVAPTSPAPLETSMPPLEGLEDIEEMEEAAADGQGAICAVTPTPKV